MTYAFGTVIVLGSSKTGLTLAAQLYDTDGNDSGAEITTGFNERGQGVYYWYYDSFASGFRGGVDIYEDGSPDSPLTGFSINPEELEYIDQALTDTGSTTNQTTILARVGSFTGTGVNTILGFLKAIASKAATLPSDIGGTFAPSSDSLEALRDYINTSATITPITAIDGDTINITRGDRFADSMSDTGVTDDYVTVDWTVKRRESDSDDDAIIRIRVNASEEDDGLMRLNGAAVSDATLASLTIASETVTWYINESVTDDLIVADGLVYDIQEIDASGTHTRVEGTCNIKPDVTRLIE